jgi:hypothetical protein
MVLLGGGSGRACSFSNRLGWVLFIVDISLETEACIEETE